MKTRKVVFSPEARDDILQLYEHVADRAGETTAFGYIERLQDYCKGFDLASERGHRRDDIRLGLRIVGFERRVTIALAVDENAIVILRLFYGGQNWEETLK